MVASAAIMNYIQQWANSEISGKSEHAPAPEVEHVVVTVGRKTAMTKDGKEVVVLPRTFDVQLSVGQASRDEARGITEDSFGAVPEGDGGHWTVRVTEVDYHTHKPKGDATTISLGNVDWSHDSPLMLAVRLDVPVDAPRQSDRVLRVQQTYRVGDLWGMQMAGSYHDLHVRTAKAHEMARIVPPLRVRDMGRVIASPMPGALISLAVSAGEEVEEGQEVAVVEAMKMQNVLRAPKKAKIGKVCAKPGDTLTLDQIIIELA